MVMVYFLFLAFVDVINILLITHVLLDSRLGFSFASKWAKKVTIRTYGASVVTILLLALSLYIGDEQVYRVASILLIPLFIRITSYVAWRFAIAIYIVAFIGTLAIQLPTIPLFLSFGLELDQHLPFILGQLITLAVALFVYLKVRLHKILWFLEKYPKLKLMLFFVTAVISTVLFFINYEQALLYWLYYLFVLGMLLLAITQIILGIGERLKPEKEIETREVEVVAQNFHGLVDEKRSNSGVVIDIESIDYMEHHGRITVEELQILFGLLLDHGLEMQKEKPIIAGLSVIDENLQIFVASECNEQEYRSYKRRQSVKNIKRLVKYYKGVIFPQYIIERTYQDDYLRLIVRIKK